MDSSPMLFQLDALYFTKYYNVAFHRCMDKLKVIFIKQNMDKVIMDEIKK